MNASFFVKRMLPVALALGTAWAARGQIGHEYGAAWAAAIGIFTVILISGRQDWYNRFPVIVAPGAIAWGSGGMISYGMIVGYGHAADYLNVSYGLLMLMIIGALYGFLGGGITGLALESTPKNKPDWAALFTQLFVGGFLFWGFFIYQLEWLMTPPRSELWAACMGAALALGWYLYRNKYLNALRTAFFSALGAGFGFGFGNFLQRMGQTTGIDFNWWNMMEYSIGFFGGLGMGYGVFSSDNWPKTIAANGPSNKTGWLFLILLLPIINLIEGTNTQTLMRTAEMITDPDPSAFAFTWQVVAWGISVVAMVFLTYYFSASRRSDGQVTKSKLAVITLSYMAWYILISNIIKAVWLVPVFSSQHLYWFNFIVLVILFRGVAVKNISSGNEKHPGVYTGNLLKWWVLAILCLLLLSYVAIQINYTFSGVEQRFK
jgi:hypothetical protein